jgi:hypothetical protein
MNVSVHFALNVIRSWDSNINSFFSARILRLFTRKQIAKFQNIFSEFIGDKVVWLEIEKMLDSGYINISLNSIYTSMDFFSYLCIEICKDYIF